MSRSHGLLWIFNWVTAFALAPIIMAQDMTSGTVTDPPAPVSEGAATFTATYLNLGPDLAHDYMVEVLVPIQPQTYPMESPGYTAMYQSMIGTDTNGNVPDYNSFASYDTCNYYFFLMVAPPPLPPVTLPNPVLPGDGGSFSWEMPSLPVGGINAGRLVITEPENLRNSYSDAGVQWEYDWLLGYAGLYNLISTGTNCSALQTDCADLESCFGHRLWATDPFEADLEVVAGDNVGWPPETDPTLGCGTSLVGFTASKIALVRRGTCPFLEKFQNAQNAGALGVIVANNGDCGTVVNYDPNECTIPMSADPATDGGLIDIPSVMMSYRQGEELFAAIQGGQTVHAMMGDVPDDDLDVINVVLSPYDDPYLFNNYVVTRVPISLLFADGFESGDTSAWSATVP